MKLDTIKDNVNWVLPESHEYVILTERSTDNIGRSVWLGLSQAVLNFPSLLFMGLWNTIKALFGAWVLFVISVLVIPLLFVLGTIFLGICGRLIDVTDPDAKDQKVIPLNLLKFKKVTDGRK